MRTLVFQMIDEVRRDGVDEEKVEDQVMILTKSLRRTLINKGLNYWIHPLIQYIHTHEEESSMADFEKTIGKIGTKKVQALGDCFFETAECVNIVIKLKRSN